MGGDQLDDDRARDRIAVVDEVEEEPGDRSSDQPAQETAISQDTPHARRLTLLFCLLVDILRFHLG